MAGTLAQPRSSSLIVHTGTVIQLNNRQFFELCRLNRDLRIERTAEGDLELMPPTAGATGNRNMRLSGLLFVWALQNATGEAFDSSTGFVLPSGAIRSPDASWLRKSRLVELSREQWEEGFVPLAPDFVVELRSSSDSIPRLQTKMREYIQNGVRLGWLLDPVERQVHVYRPHAEDEVLNDPPQVSADPELPGFILDLHVVWGSTP